jgi:FkbM family methyltransferase
MNSGFFSLVASALGTPVLAFDPQPVCHALMKKSIERNGFTNIETVMAGLGDGGRAEVAAVMRMHVSACSGGYSWPDVWGKGMDTVVDVPMRTLSDVVGNRRVALMKMVHSDDVDLIGFLKPFLLLIVGIIQHL